ncbi:MAG: dATP/dGTP diphosphohydrolase domain-containing protein, partial [Clostridia bacterium]
MGETLKTIDRKNYDNFHNGAMREKKKNKGRFDLISPIMLYRLSCVLEESVEKFKNEPGGARNWERGLPLSNWIDSLIRHIVQFGEGMNDEDHLGHALFNLMGLVHTHEMIVREKLPKELDYRE